MPLLTRRHFLAGASTAAACLPAVAALPSAAARVQSRRRGPMTERIPMLAEPFPLEQVRVLDSPFLQSAQVNQDYLESLPAERLVHMFRVTAGLPSSAQPLGGWESPTTELRGHFTGHYLSATGLMYASTGNSRIKQQGDAIVAELAACQKANKNGYISAFPEEFFDRLANDKQVWAPFYTLHKIMAGNLDMYTYCGNQQALEVAEGLARWTGHWVTGMGDAQMQRIMRTEFGGMAESLWNLAAITGNYSYAATAQRFEKTVFLEPLAAHRDALKGLHVNTHIPQVIAAARKYELTGDPKYHEIANYFWHEVVEERSYAPGGTSNGEGWGTDPGQLGHALSRSSQECCCGYNMLKLTRHLYQWTADPRYFDYYERTLWNSRLGTEHPGDGGKMYYFPLQTGWWKYFSSKTNSFWCCDGTGAEEFSKFGDSIYWRGRDGRSVMVNLFIPSELNWKERSFGLRQTTRFPEEEGTTLTVRASQPLALAVNLRIPSWVTEGGSVAVNGQSLPVFSNPGSYLTLDRTWHDGDTIALKLPMKLRAVALKGDETQQAAMYGPLVLGARLGSDGLTEAMQYDVDTGGTIVAPRGRPQGSATITLPRGARAEDAAWIKKGSGLEFETVGQASPTALIPLHQILGERYAVYWKMNQPSFGRGA
ncbi:MAG: beta-L-arabinofuranosidase domain-containing protein [Terriglobales bacterium]